MYMIVVVMLMTALIFTKSIKNSVVGSRNGMNDAVLHERLKRTVERNAVELGGNPFFDFAV